ncbi:MAG: dockerin type I repeat-containing protein [Candidatus Daviesbacteria bacterium]|nr:dockerin type I repeat-containing protein [Candidatus Daviesbacteria bacterium]
MFDFDKKTLLILGGFIIIVIAIPFTAVMVKQTQVFRSRASEIKVSTSSAERVISDSVAQNGANEIPATSPLDELTKLVQSSPSVTPSANSTDNPATTGPTPTPYVNLGFGPTLNISIAIQGRPTNKQAVRAFIGLAGNTPVKNPTYVLTFTVDFPEDGIFRGLSLAGLNPGSTYSVYIKGPGQIDSASFFVMSPTESTVNSNQAISLLSGDLNDDNTINSTDYTIAKNLYGTTPTSRAWNKNADFNRDNIINTYDLGYVTSNLGKTGASGTWFSPPPQATSSGSPSGGPASPTGGYWLWMP